MIRNIILAVIMAASSTLFIYLATHDVKWLQAVVDGALSVVAPAAIWVIADEVRRSCTPS